LHYQTNGLGWVGSGWGKKGETEKQHSATDAAAEIVASVAK